VDEKLIDPLRLAKSRFNKVIAPREMAFARMVELTDMA